MNWREKLGHLKLTLPINCPLSQYVNQSVPVNFLGSGPEGVDDLCPHTLGNFLLLLLLLLLLLHPPLPQTQILVLKPKSQPQSPSPILEA